jgi:ketosteroid isomerase-like protein
MSALTDYIAAWKTNDTERIAETVTEDVVITESFGPVYYGRERVREWCEKWNEEGSRVLDWTITNEAQAGDLLMAEWRFEYHQDGEDRTLLGATIATQRDGKIAQLREYAVTADLYTWEGEWR